MADIHAPTSLCGIDIIPKIRMLYHWRIWQVLSFDNKSFYLAHSFPNSVLATSFEKLSQFEYSIYSFLHFENEVARVR